MFKTWLDNIFAHPKTTAAGVIAAVLVIGPVLANQGISLGHAGTGTTVQLIGGLATALLGLISKDPSS